jgi:DNA repair protein RecN (Recombination protein N)
MGALGLILGDRADSSALVNKEKKCIVEGVFKTENKAGVKTFLKDNELDGDGRRVVLRREIAVNGKSRAFINDTPVNLEQLRRIKQLAC